ELGDRDPVKRTVWLAGGALVCGLALVALMPRRSDEPKAHRISSLVTKASPVEASATRNASPDASIAATVVSRAPDPRTDLDVEPHPLTAEREIAARQHALFAAVQEAIEGGSFGLARDLL